MFETEVDGGPTLGGRVTPSRRLEHAGVSLEESLAEA